MGLEQGEPGADSAALGNPADESPLRPPAKSSVILRHNKASHNDKCLSSVIVHLSCHVLLTLSNPRSLPPSLGMQRWPGQGGQCVFCTFKSVTRQTSKTPQHRRFRSQPALSYGTRADRSKPNLRLSRAPNSINKSPSKHLDFEEQGNGKHRPSKSEGREILAAVPMRWTANYEPKEPERLNEAILNRLNTLEAELKTINTTSDSDVSKLQTLDPEGKHWPKFKQEIIAMVKSAQDGKRRAWTRGQEALYTPLERAFKAGYWKTKVHDDIYFAFLDHVIGEDSKTENSAASRHTDLRYPTEWYAMARSVQRDIHLHVGPTNSGKTYTALKRLEEAGSGFYCGPLRLLAHEVYSRFQAKGIRCDLVTGDDVRRDDISKVNMTSSTVEMVDTTQPVEVAVIDEIQMMAHIERGWAWTRAFLGANAKEVHLCGETRVVPLVRELAASMGDTLHIHNYKRLSPLKVMNRSLRGNLKTLRLGDCVVSFSILGIHAMKKQIERDTGRRVAIVYGGLPSETRAQQAALFNDPNNDYDYLVASDAIGMGLNLAIKRIIFESVYKFNGKFQEILSVPQIKQISGRAGRFRTANQATEKDDPNKSSSSNTSVGLVTCLEEADLAVIQEALRTEPEPIKTAGLQPPVDFVEEFAARLPKGLPFEYILLKLNEIAQMHPRFKLCDIKDQRGIAKVIEPVREMTINQRYLFTAAPADYRNPVSQKLIKALAECVPAGKSVTVVDIPEMPLEVLEEPMSADRVYLERLENLHKSLILFLWLSYRFMGTFKDQEMAQHAKKLVEQRINEALLKFSHADLLQRQKRLARPQGQGQMRGFERVRIGEDGDGGAAEGGIGEGSGLSHQEPDTKDLPVDPKGRAEGVAGEELVLLNKDPETQALPVDPVMLPADWPEGGNVALEESRSAHG